MPRKKHPERAAAYRALCATLAQERAAREAWRTAPWAEKDVLLDAIARAERAVREARDAYHAAGGKPFARTGARTPRARTNARLEW